jgi:hypothetical protein
LRSFNYICFIVSIEIQLIYSEWGISLYELFIIGILVYYGFEIVNPVIQIDVILDGNLREIHGILGDEE